jgi:hypothetical protein
MTREARPERRDGPTGHAKGIVDLTESVPFLGALRLFRDFLSVLFPGTEFVCSHLSVPV